MITDSPLLTGADEENLPYSFKRSRLNLRGDVTVFGDLGLAAGYDRTELDRDFQEVAEQDEDGGWGQVRWRPRSWFDLRARGGASKREVDRYDTTVAASFGQNPLLRKYNLAYRFRQYGEATLAVSIPERPLSIELGDLGDVVRVPGAGL